VTSPLCAIGIPATHRGGIIRLEEMIMKTGAALSRRRLLASIPAVAAAAVPAAPTALLAHPTHAAADASGNDPVLTALAAHKAAYAEIATLESCLTGDKDARFDRLMDTALWHSLDMLRILLNTMPTTTFGLACVLQHLATPLWNDPGNPNILVSAYDAGDDGVKAAAKTYLARLGAAVLAMSGRAAS
jgi:hypothetical protein